MGSFSIVWVSVCVDAPKKWAGCASWRGLADLIPLAPLTKQNFCRELVAICTRTQVLGVGVLTVPSGS